MPFDTKILGYYFTGYGSKLVQISAPFMTPFLFQYNADEYSIAVAITTQSNIPLFVFKHLASYMLCNYSKMCLKTTVFNRHIKYFCASQYTRTCALNYLPA